jgi:uncharacterized membrane protein
VSEETYERRKEDKHLTSLERRIGQMEVDIADIKSILRFDVVRKEAFINLEKLVGNTVSDIATKREIDTALQKQTKELKSEKATRFTRREKWLASLTGISLIVINILELFYHVHSSQ